MDRSVGCDGGFMNIRPPQVEHNPGILESSCSQPQWPEIYSAFFESAPDPMMISDEEGRILQLNTEAERQFGHQREELLGQRVDNVIPECFRNVDDRHPSIYGSPSSYRSRNHWQQMIGRRKDGSKFSLEVSRTRVPTQDGTIFFITLRNCTELSEQLVGGRVIRRRGVKFDYSKTGVVGNSAGICNVLKRAEQVACTDSAVLILGETGTGKELIAQTIHETSRRNARPMVKINCAALPATLIESELFGRERGAYTGALAREIGRFELADKSTIFLDEIGELPTELQPKLLRVLQEGEFERLGSSRTMRVDVRIIAATNRDLQALVRERKFREDLFYRLNVFPIEIPPLRERREDIPALAWHILNDLGTRMGRNIQAVHASTMRDFQKHSWPGNVRELRNVIERNLILNAGSIFRAELPTPTPNGNGGRRRLDEIEAEHIRNVLQSTHWRVRGRGGAAEVVGLKPTTLEARMNKLGIRRATHHTETLVAQTDTKSN